MKNIGGRKILIIAAGDWQVPVIQKAQSMGLKVVATDRNPEAPGLKIADFPEAVDIIDFEGTLEVARKHKVNGVITEQTDLAVPTAAYVAEKMGLPGVSYEAAMSATNKWLMREKCKKAGIPMPEYRKAANLDEAANAAVDIGFPVIVKPVDNQGSRGVRRVENHKDLKECYNLARSYSRENSVLIEEFLVGIESTVEGFVNDGKVYVLAISDKKHLPPPHCVAVSLTYPPAFPEHVISEIERWNIETVKALGITMGITHAEFMLTDKGPYLIEIASRGGGTRISTHIILAVSGIDVIEGLIHQCLGERFEVGNRVSNAAILEFFILPPGRVKSINGIGEARRLEGIIEIDFQVAPGDMIGVIDADRLRPGFLIATAKTRHEVLMIAEKVKSIVKVEMESPDEG